jgi:malate/lactate dehydrogenase
MSFWKISVFGEPQTMPPMSSEESGMRQYVQSGEAELPGKNAEHFYTESEVDTLIDDLSEAAKEAIEQAAAEAARAAALAALEREAAVMREAQRLQGENSRLKQSRVKTAIVTGVICFFGGLAIGAGSIAILQGVR